jgi:hypothetical protein
VRRAPATPSALPVSDTLMFDLGAEHLMFRQAGGRFVGLCAASLCSVVTNCNGRHADVINVSSLNLAKTIVYHPSLFAPP